MSEQPTPRASEQDPEAAREREQMLANAERHIRRHANADTVRRGGVDTWLGTTAIVIVCAVIAALLVVWLLLM